MSINKDFINGSNVWLWTQREAWCALLRTAASKPTQSWCHCQCSKWLSVTNRLTPLHSAIWHTISCNLSFQPTPLTIRTSCWPQWVIALCDLHQHCKRLLQWEAQVLHVHSPLAIILRPFISHSRQCQTLKSQYMSARHTMKWSPHEWQTLCNVDSDLNSSQIIINWIWGIWFHLLFIDSFVWCVMLVGEWLTVWCVLIDWKMLCEEEAVASNPQCPRCSAEHEHQCQHQSLTRSNLHKWICCDCIEIQQCQLDQPWFQAMVHHTHLVTMVCHGQTQMKMCDVMANYEHSNDMTMMSQVSEGGTKEKRVLLMMFQSLLALEQGCWNEEL